jgi:hypothetical protein
VLAWNKVHVFRVFPKQNLSTAIAAAIAVFVGITQPDELAEYAVKFRF